MTQTVILNKIYYSKTNNGFYHSQIHQSMPADIVEIDKETYDNLLNGQAIGKNIAVDDKGYPILIEPIPLSLEKIKNNLIKNIDSDAENERLKYITSGTGQIFTYIEKAQQALDYSGKYTAYLADKTNMAPPDDKQYPLLDASIGVDGATILEVAENVSHSFLLWQNISAKIEAIRLKAKIEIAAAATEQAAKDIYEQTSFSSL